MKQMLPYFTYQAITILQIYITCSVIEDIPLFDGAHVARHRDSRLNEVSCDQFGEHTYISVCSKDGIVGICLSAEQVPGWVLSYHICH